MLGGVVVVVVVVSGPGPAGKRLGPRPGFSALGGAAQAAARAALFAMGDRWEVLFYEGEMQVCSGGRLAAVL